MSSVAILSDIHANFPAFQAVLKDVMSSGASEIVFLGDIVGRGASPAKCVDLVRKLGGRCVMGNHDVLMDQFRAPGFKPMGNPKRDGYLAGLIHSAKELDDNAAAWIKGLPYLMAISGAVAAHASLNNPRHFHYIEDSESAKSTLALLATQADRRVGFVGHTHLQKVFSDDDGSIEWLDGSRFRVPENLACVVTVGSVGQTRHEDDLRAAWVLWQPGERIVEFRRVEYDRMKAATETLEAGLPAESALRLLTDEEVQSLMH